MNENDTHFKLTDLEFEKRFADGSLNPVLFTHEAHLRLAWIHIDKYGVENAIDNICCQLAAFITALGAYDKYNKTVTVAAIRAVYHFKLKSRSDNFQNFIIEFPRLKHNFKQIVQSHYSTDIFKSELAKQQYLEPDTSIRLKHGLAMI
jgi:hypothetical protein